MTIPGQTYGRLQFQWPALIITSHFKTHDGQGGYHSVSLMACPGDGQSNTTQCNQVNEPVSISAWDVHEALGTVLQTGSRWWGDTEVWVTDISWA